MTYTKNRAVINQRKGSDGGIDGIAFLLTDREGIDRAVFQAKSGTVKRDDIAKLRGDMQRENAALGFFITLEEPTSSMRTEAARSGTYYHALTGRTMNRIQIVTIREMLEGRQRLDLPMTLDLVKNGPEPRLGGKKIYSEDNRT